MTKFHSGFSSQSWSIQKQKRDHSSLQILQSLPWERRRGSLNLLSLLACQGLPGNVSKESIVQRPRSATLISFVTQVQIVWVCLSRWDVYSLYLMWGGMCCSSWSLFGQGFARILLVVESIVREQDWSAVIQAVPVLWCSNPLRKIKDLASIKLRLNEVLFTACRTRQP